MQNHHRTILFFLVCCFLCFCTNSGQAQFAPPDYFTYPLELPGDVRGNSVNNMTQDKEGYLWFSSQDGLHRYDGFQFKSWYHDPQNPNSLSSSYIEWCLVDKNNNLWVGSYLNGLNLFDHKTETFTRFLHESKRATSISDNQVTCMVQDNVGNIWVGTEGGLNRLDPNTREFTRFLHDPKNERSINSNIIKSLLVDHNGILWVGTSSDNQLILNRYNPGNGTFSRFPLPTPYNPNQGIWALEEDSKGQIWVGTATSGLYIFDRQKGSFKPLPVDPINWRGKKPGDQAEQVFAQVSFIHEDLHKKIWIGSFGGGLNVYDPKTGAIHAFQQESRQGGPGPRQFPKYCFRICETRDGTIFVSTGGQGKIVLKIRPRSEQLQHFNLSHNPNTNQSANFVFTLQERSPNNFIIETNENVLNYALKNRQSQVWPSASEAKLFRELGIRHFAKDRDNNLWILCNQRIFQYTSNGRLIGDFVKNKIRYPSGFLHAKDGSYWITTGFQGLARIYPRQDSVSYIELPTFPLSKIIQQSLLKEKIKLSRGTYAHHPIEDKQGNIWIAAGFTFEEKALQISEGGAFFKVDRKSQNVSSFWPEEVPRNMLSALLLDRHGKFWLAIRGSGIYTFDPATAQFTAIKPVGFLNATLTQINFLEEDADGHIWMATPSELITYNPQLNTYSFFNRNNGLFISNLYDLKKLSNDQLGLGTNNGIYVFTPRLMRKSSKAPELGFTELSIAGEVIQPGSSDVLPRPLAEMDRLRLSHRSNVFSIGFAVFHFDDPAHNRVQYFLEGYDPDWREVKGEPSAQYVNVPPGNYQFRVRAANAKGIWMTQPKSIEIIVTPPWWQKTWAILLFIGLLSAVVAFFYRWRMATQRHKLILRERELQQEREQLEKERRMNERLQQVDKLKDQFLANTSHELRTPLQGIIGLSEALLESELDPERKANLSMVVSSGKRLNSLVNDILDFSKLKNADIELDQRPINLHSMADVVLKNISPLVAGKPIELLNDVSIDLPSAMADENRLQQILYNLLGNAAKFTEKGYIKIDAREEHGMLVVSVEDTGSGIAPEKSAAIFQEFTQGDSSTTRAFAGTGLGLSISKKLVELHGGTIWLDSTPGQGSSFFFSLPPSSVEEVVHTNPIALEPKTTKSTLRGLLSEVQKAQDETVANLMGTKKEELSQSALFRSVNPSPSEEPGDAPVHILVVDDEPINQQVLKSHLSALKYHITPALNGEEALKALENGNHFDLVLLDVMMPRMSGYEVCEHIRKRFLPSELPVIMITAKNQVQDLVQGLNTGANDYITKPFTKDEFLARVKTHLNLHRIHSATGRFVPTEFIRSLGRESITDVQLGDQTEKEVTVLFSDIRDFTGLSEKMTPEENFRFVNAFHGRLGPIVQSNGGFINQYLGDGIMAIFTQKPEDALKASIMMQKNIRAYNLTRLTKGRTQIRTGMGMHTGPLIMGIIGDDKRMDAATISDTVNTASRIESLTKFYGANILISEDSLAGIPDRSPFNLRFLGKVLVKGKEHELGIYECIDGDEPEMLWYKRSTLEDFEHGVKLYFERKFTAAAEVFKDKVLRRNPRDMAAKILLNKAQHLAEQGVPADWTGVDKMDFK